MANQNIGTIESFIKEKKNDMEAERTYSNYLLVPFSRIQSERIKKKEEKDKEILNFVFMAIEEKSSLFLKMVGQKTEIFEKNYNLIIPKINEKYNKKGLESVRNQLNELKDDALIIYGKKYFEDFVDTSSEEDSESEEENESFCEIFKDKIKKFQGAERKKLYRGFHLDKKENYKGRRKILELNNLKNSDINSQATSNLIKKHDTTPEVANILLNSQLNLLKITPDRQERNSEKDSITTDKETRVKSTIRKVSSTKRTSPKGKGSPFENLFYHFINDYVNSYIDLFDSKTINSFEHPPLCMGTFNCFSTDNPFVSTIDSIDNTFKYSIGNTEMMGVNRNLLKIRKTNSFLKHKNIGYVQVYLVLNDYIKSYVHHIEQLNGSKIQIKARREGGEYIFQSSIPNDFVVGYFKLSIPTFKHDWSNKYFLQYGLNETKYNYYKRMVVDGSLFTSTNNVFTNFDSLCKLVFDTRVKLLSGQFDEYSKQMEQEKKAQSA